MRTKYYNQSLSQYQNQEISNNNNENEKEKYMQKE